MNLKILILSLITSASLLAQNNLKFEPILDATLQIESKVKDIDNSIIPAPYRAGLGIPQEETVSYMKNLIGGKVGFKTLYENFYITAAIHGIIRQHHDDYSDKPYEESVYRDDYVGYNYLGDAHIGAAFDTISFKVGRQTHNDRLVGENLETTANSYEGGYLEYKNDSFKIDAFYFNTISSSPLAYAVPQNHDYGALGYGKGYKVGEYVNLSEHIMGEAYKNKPNDGAINLNIKLGSKETNFHIENLYVDNFFNTLSLTSRYNFEFDETAFNVKLGYIRQDKVGKNNLDADIDSQLYQARFKFSYEKFKLTYRVSQTGTNKDAIYNGTLISPFSNKPAWIYGPKTAHAFIADTFSQQIIISNIFYIGEMPILSSLGHVRYEIGKDNGLTLIPNLGLGAVATPAITTTESYVDIRPYFAKNFYATLQYSYAQNITPLRPKTNNVRVNLSYAY